MHHVKNMSNMPVLINCASGGTLCIAPAHVSPLRDIDLHTPEVQKLIEDKMIVVLLNEKPAPEKQKHKPAEKTNK